MNQRVVDLMTDLVRSLDLDDYPLPEQAGLQKLAKQLKGLPGAQELIRVIDATGKFATDVESGLAALEKARKSFLDATGRTKLAPELRKAVDNVYAAILRLRSASGDMRRTVRRANPSG